MSERIQGAIHDRIAFAHQMAKIHEQFPMALIIGSIGRAAAYAAYDWPHAPLKLLKPGGKHRDVDAILTPFLAPAASDCWTPHHLDRGMEMYIWAPHPLRPALELVGEDADRQPFTMEADVDLFTPHTRYLDGVPINTPSIGVLQQIGHIAGPGDLSAAEHAKYDHSCTEFDAFATAARSLAPHEFPPADQIAPLAEFALRNRY